ncbi:hypothetical protein [Streptomyces sp. NPDC058991]|uniref:hypothetical protein n=1 Tax=unclassified Streptomyces TaxID=2593676 RepID=UPI00368A6000
MSRQREPDFLVLDYVTITQDRRTGLVVAIGGTQQAAEILQRCGFLDAPGPRGDYHRLPHGLPFEQQCLKATAASHGLLAAGHSVHLDAALNVLSSPDGDRLAAQRYLAQLAERAGRATDDREVAEVLTEIAAPAQGLLPLLREVVVRAGFAWAEHLDGVGHATEPADRLMSTADSLSSSSRQIARVRNEAARTPAQPSPPGPCTGLPKPPSGPATLRPR